MDRNARPATQPRPATTTPPGPRSRPPSPPEGHSDRLPCGPGSGRCGGATAKIRIRMSVRAMGLAAAWQRPSARSFSRKRPRRYSVCIRKGMRVALLFQPMRWSRRRGPSPRPRSPRVRAAADHAGPCGGSHDCAPRGTFLSAFPATTLIEVKSRPRKILDNGHDRGDPGSSAPYVMGGRSGRTIPKPNPSIQSQQPKCLRIADPVRSYFQLGQNTCGSSHATMGLSCGLKARIRVN